jgi:hypothetical protein
VHASTWKAGWRPASRSLRAARAVLHVVVLTLVLAAIVDAHDLERTQVVLTFAADGSFVLDVTNDASWLKDRLESIPGPFADRIVLWVDGREVRTDSVERIPGPASTTHRLRGRVPHDARTLRWFYGLVGDPYPLTVRRADGRIIVEEIAGNAWSQEIDLRGQFSDEARWPIYAVAALFIVSAAAMLIRANTKDTKNVKRHQGDKGFD